MKALAEPTTFHLVRHAAHALLPHTLAGRMPGVGLSAEGRAQAARLAARIGRLDHVVTSPVQRARETAAALAGPRAAELEPGFEEIDFGAWCGQAFEVLAPDPEWQRWNTIRSLARCPGGETMAEAQSRALAALDRLRTARPGQTIAIVSHADILKALLAATIGLSLDHLQRLTLDPASISTLVVSEDTLRVDGINR